MHCDISRSSLALIAINVHLSLCCEMFFASCECQGETHHGSECWWSRCACRRDCSSIPWSSEAVDSLKDTRELRLLNIAEIFLLLTCTDIRIEPKMLRHVLPCQQWKWRRHVLIYLFIDWTRHCERFRTFFVRLGFESFCFHHFLWFSFFALKNLFSFSSSFLATFFSYFISMQKNSWIFTWNTNYGQLSTNSDITQYDLCSRLIKI